MGSKKCEIALILLSCTRHRMYLSQVPILLQGLVGSNFASNTSSLNLESVGSSNK